MAQQQLTGLMLLAPMLNNTLKTNSKLKCIWYSSVKDLFINFQYL